MLICRTNLPLAPIYSWTIALLITLRLCLISETPIFRRINRERLYISPFISHDSYLYWNGRDLVVKIQYVPLVPDTRQCNRLSMPPYMY